MSIPMTWSDIFLLTVTLINVGTHNYYTLCMLMYCSVPIEKVLPYFYLPSVIIAVINQWLTI
jgi:hypothetical protein